VTVSPEQHVLDFDATPEEFAQDCRDLLAGKRVWRVPGDSAITRDEADRHLRLREMVERWVG